MCRVTHESATSSTGRDSTIAVVILTNNRVELLRKCVENVLSKTSPATREILIWNNASTDGTKDYLESLNDERIVVVNNDENIAQNAYAEAFRRTSAEYLVELDDDVTDAPERWDAQLLDAYRTLPRLGFLAADLVEDENDEGSWVRHQLCADMYEEFEEAGLRLLRGPAGGACAMTSREVYDRVGGFPQKRDAKGFFSLDGSYIAAIEAAGFRKVVLADLLVHHTGGPYYAGINLVKDKFWRDYFRKVKTRNAVKKTLLRIPLVPRLNERYGFFGPLERVPPPFPGRNREPLSANEQR